MPGPGGGVPGPGGGAWSEGVSGPGGVPGPGGGIPACTEPPCGQNDRHV